TSTPPRFRYTSSSDLAHGEARRALEEVRQILHPRPQLPNQFLFDRLLRPAQRDDLKAETPALELEQLAQNERLRQARETIDDHDQVDIAACELRHLGFHRQGAASPQGRDTLNKSRVQSKNLCRHEAAKNSRGRK